MDKLLWKLFKETGDIKYYLMMKKAGSGSNENKKSRGNNNKRTKL